MKWMAASDIHGNAEYCDLLLRAYQREGAEKLLLCGDLSMYGWPSVNDSGATVADQLNEIAEDIYCVLGNCDDPYEQQDYDFQMRQEYLPIPFGKRTIHLAHGHRIGPNRLPKHNPGDWLLCGHTHIPACEWIEDMLYLNPGSASKPRGGSWHGYLILTDEKLVWKDLWGHVMMEEDAI